MKNAVLLSPEQKKAKEMYKLAFAPAVFVSCFVVLAILIGFDCFVRWVGWSNSQNSSSGTGGAIGVVSLFAAHLWAMRKVRRAGLSLEKTETELVSNTAQNTSVGALKWWFPRTVIGRIGLALSPFLLGAASWWQWHSAESFWFEGAQGAAGFLIFSCIGIINLPFVRFPYVQIDERGIAGFQKDWWRRRASWQDVACCEIKRATNFSGEITSHWFTFKDENDKVLLILSPRSMFGLTDDEREAVAAEIKRRMTSVDG